VDYGLHDTSSSRELIAQGTGNIVSGLLGGLPVTSVIVRSSANVMAGARTKLSAIFHGVLLLLFVLFLPELLNKIPKASLAGILIFTGYKLAKFELFREYYQKGWNQFLPFIITILAIVFTDLLTGIIIGCSAGIFFVIHTNFNSAVTVLQDKDMHILRFNKDATFINKGHLKKILKKIPPYSTVRIDVTRCNFIDQDIIDLVNDFIVNAGQKHIVVQIDKKNGEEKSVFNDLQQRTTT
jgi:MFS superfamily sulfate permease-like transporter